MHTFPGCFRHLHILPRGRMSQIHYPGQVRGVTVNMAADNPPVISGEQVSVDPDGILSTRTYGLPRNLVFRHQKSDRNTRALPLTLHSVNRVNCNIPCWEIQEGMLALYGKNNRLRIRMEKAIIRRTGMRMWSGKELVRLWVEKFSNWKQNGFAQKGR